MLRLLYNFVFLTKNRTLTIKALAYSAVARVRVRFLSAQKLYPYMGIQGEETSSERLDPEQRKNASQVADKIKRVAVRTPWESRCLVQAMVAQRLLLQYDLPSTLYLGVGRDDAQKMVAHAWLRCGHRYICGGDGSPYATVTTFAMYPPKTQINP